jgi:TrmH family RNA methyltransferase
MITSASNPQIRLLRDVLREPAAHGVFAVEGLRAVEETLRAGVKVETVYYSAKIDEVPRALTLLDSLVQRGAEKLQVAEGLLDRVSATRTGQGIIALLHKLEWSVDDLLRTGRPVFVLDGLRDPGNAGTIIRVADAFGLGGIVLSDDSVEPYNDKVVRSAMGSLFRVPLLRGELAPLLARFKESGYRLAAADAHADRTIGELPAQEKFAVILGNEAHGIRPATESAAGLRFRIPTPGEAESLNVGVSAGIIAYALTSR